MTALTDTLAWFVVAAFGASAILQGESRRTSRYAAVLAWVLFAAFWALLTPHFAFVQRSIIEGVLSAAAVPACLYTAYLVGSGRKDLETLTRAVAIMGLLPSVPDHRAAAAVRHRVRRPAGQVGDGPTRLPPAPSWTATTATIRGSSSSARTA